MNTETKNLLLLLVAEKTKHETKIPHYSNSKNNVLPQYRQSRLVG